MAPCSPRSISARPLVRLKARQTGLDLQRQAARQKTPGVTLGLSAEEGIILYFTDAQDTAAPVAEEA